MTVLHAALLALTAAAAPQDRGNLLIDRNRIDRAPTAPVPVATPEPRTAIVPADMAAPEIVIAGIAFEGVDAPARVARAAEPFLGERASAATLQRLAAVLSGAYAKADVALYTVAIPKQDFADGVVRVRIVEGRIARVEVADGTPPRRHRLLRQRLDPLTRETPLSRARFERQLTLAREIPGLAFDTELTDPDNSGALTLGVTPKQRRTRFSLGFSNRGLDLLGPGQLDAKAELFGGLVDGDRFELAAAASTDFEQLRYGSASYAAPIGAGGLSLGLTGAYLETRPDDFPVTGRAKAAGATLGYAWLRGFKRSGDVSLGIDGIDSDNAVLGNLFSRERTRALRGAASFAASGARRQVVVAGSVSQGLAILGARPGDPFADTRFRKATLVANAAQAIGKRAAVRVNASGQYSGDALPAAERYAIGGESIGRAFETAFLTGDRGLGGLVELAWRPVKATRFANSEVYAFGDAASVGVESRGELPRQDVSIASAGIGARVRYRDKAEIGLEGARVIDKPFAGFDDDWRVSVAWRLSL